MKLVVDLNRLEGFDEWVEKARKGEQVGGSYIYRENIPEKVTTKNGKTVIRRYYYYYVADMLKDTADKILKNIGSFFFKGKPEEVKRIEKSYETENIQKDYGADKKTWYQHVMEYFSHRALWDKRFSDKTVAEKWKKPVKTAVAEKVNVKGMETPAESVAEIKTSAEVKKPEKKWKANPSLMRKVWSLYTGKQAEKQEKQTETAAMVIEENKKKPENSAEYFTPKKVDWYEAFAGSWNTFYPTGTGMKPYINISRKGARGEKIGESKRANSKTDLSGLFDGVNDFVFNTEYIGEKSRQNFIERLADLGFHAQKEYTDEKGNTKYMLMIRDGSKAGLVEMIPNSDYKKKEYTVITHDEAGNETDKQVFSDIDSAQAFMDKQRKALEAGESEAEKHENRSNAMLGNQNAKKFGMPEDVYEIMRNMVSEQVNGQGVKNRQILFEKLYKKDDYFRKKLDMYGGTSNEEITGYNRSDIFNALYDDVTGGEHGEDNSGIGRNGLSTGTSDLRSGRGEEPGNQNAASAARGNNGIETVLGLDTSGNGLGNADSSVNIGRGRITKGQAREIRRQCREILQKPDYAITAEDKAVLAQYVGAGGTGEEDSSNSGVLYEFYTPRNVISKVWQIVDKYNPDQGKTVIEPSSGIGRFAEGRKEKFTMFELENESARIAHILHPDADVVQGAFQENFMKNKGGRFTKKFKPYDVAVGNPPYGAYTGKYKGLGEGKEYKRYETYFMSRTLDTLKDGGVMAMVVPSGFMDGKSTYGKDIEKIAEKGELLEAWRLPNGTFDSTDVGTDIVVFRKGKGGSAEQIKSYFEKNPDHIAGEISTRTNRFGKEESYVKPKDGQTFESAVDSIDVGARETKEQADAISELIGAKETEAEKHQNRSEAMKGNQNAKKLDISDKLKDTGRTGTAKNGKNYKIWDTTDEFWSIYKQKKDALKANGYQLVKTRGGWKVYDYNIDGGNSSKTAAKKKENRSLAMLGNKNAEGEHNVSVNPNAHKMSVEEFNKKYGKNFDPKDIPIWKATDRSGNIDITRLSNEEADYVAKSDHYVKNGGMYVNVVNYASGNIREKLNALSNDDPQYEVKKALLEAVCPKEKKIGEFTLSPITDWAREYKTADGRSLIDGFFEWAYNGNAYYSAGDSPVAREEIPPDISFNDIKDFINKVPYQMSRAESRDFDGKKQREKAKERRKQQRRETAIKLFNRYLQEGLALDEQKRLTEAWNLKANSFVNPDFTKIPVFVDGMSTHKGSKEFTLLEQQMKGISMLTNKGTGLLAYDVGVGKTACGVVATVNQIQTGRAKRPLICVPKAVYSNWIANIHELFPDIKVNGLGNLSKNYWNTGMTIEPGSISVCTYEGLENIAFNAQEESEIKEDVEFAEFTDDNEKKESARQKASKDEKINERIGNIQKTRNEGVQFSDLGFDHITVDEVHNFRNLFKMPRHIKKNKEDEDKVESNEFDGLGSGGEPSERAKKLFAITQLIQRHNDGRNTFLLSATPFQNSPTEIYSILSYMARDELKKRGFYSLEQFVSNFCKVQREYVVKANRVTEAPVVKGFEDLSELQNLLTSYMDKVDGEEAGVVRPYKRMHAPELELSDMQKDIMANISNYIEGQEKKPKKERDDGYMFRAMNAMKNCALSPALVTDSEFNPYDGKKLDFVETSPKLKFVCDSIIAQYKKDSHNGQIMYMPLGVEQFPKVKDYLVKHGMPKDAIATISGGATTDKAMETRDNIFRDFNDVNGKCKVIIGSSTIKEGCNLQGNTTTIYCTQLDWNPTDVQQLWGRGWRQGNRQGIVHCVTPLMHDSLDPMIYQKHDEKSSRTNDIYSYKGNAMNSQDVNPEELKFSLIKDPAKRADLQVMEYSEKNKSDEKMYGQLIDVLHKQIDIAFESDKEIESRCNNVLPFRMNRSLEGLVEENKKNKAGLDSAKKAITILTKKYKGKEEKWKEDYSKIADELNALDISNLYISTFRTQSFDETIGDLNDSSRSLQANIDSNNSYIRMYNKTKTKLEKTREATRKYLESKGMNTKEDCEQKIQDYVKLMDTAKENAAKAKDMRDEFYRKAVEDNVRNEKNLLSVDELVKENVDSIMGDLHPMDDDFKAKIKAENDRRFGRVAKSLPLFFIMDGRLYINRSRIGM